MKQQFHTPRGTLIVDLATASDAELEQLGMSQERATITLQMIEENDPVKKLEKRIAELEKLKEK